MRGRPPKEVTRDVIFKIRLTAEEAEMLTNFSERTGQTKSEVFRKAIEVYFDILKGEEQ
jgi:predicted DNA-binding protein